MAEVAVAPGAKITESAGPGLGEVLLAGLDGGTPLGFLAGVGVQRVLADGARMEVGLSWRLLDTWRPVLHGAPDLDAVVGVVAADAAAWAGAPVLRFRYVKVEKGGPKAFGGLRAPVAVLRRWLEDRRAEGDEGSIACACALMCETASEAVQGPATAQDLAALGIGAAAEAPLDRATLPTAFDFTSRNAQFLDQVEAIRAGLTPEVIEAGLREGRPDAGEGRSMDWDPTADTPGAIYTGFRRGFLPVAEWLAFRGLSCFPVSGVGESLRTTGCSGRRKEGAFVWPLWQVPAGPETVRSLVAWPDLEELERDAREALGLGAVLRAGLTKKADGYAGVFSPAVPV